MTYLVYLNHYNIRQSKAQYLSVLYEVLGKGLNAHFILNEDYLKKYKIEDRWEVKWTRNHWGDYDKVYGALKPENYTVMRKPETFLSSKVPSIILSEAVNTYPQEEIKVIEEILSRKEIKAGVTWVNNKCFKHTLLNHGKMVFHHEMGPFRPTIYIPTIYLDFSGVNGDTEFNERFQEFLKVSNKVPILSKKELLKVLSPRHYPYLHQILDNKNREFEAGVGLQVEVDTNLLLFNHGYNWVDPILKAEAESTGKVLVRPHPAAGFSLKPIDSRIVVDDPSKGKVQDFINKCDKIYCLNSSVGLEAILLGRKAEILGDSPFRSICNMDEETQLKALNFAVFGYLIHRSLLFNNDYYTFRLNNIGNEKLIYLDNMKRLLEGIKE